jgi:hypothetical protein
MTDANGEFGSETYSGIIQVGHQDLSYAAIITLAEWNEWNNVGQASLSQKQLDSFLDGLAAVIKDHGTYVEVLFGQDEKYRGRLTRLHQDEAIVEVAEDGDWYHGSEAIISAEQARQILALFNR